MFTARWLCVIFFFLCFSRDRITGRKNKGEKKCCHQLRMWNKSASFFSRSPSTSCATDNNIQHNTIPDDIYCFYSNLRRKKKRRKNTKNDSFLLSGRVVNNNKNNNIKSSKKKKRKALFYYRIKISTCARVSSSPSGRIYPESSLARMMAA